MSNPIALPEDLRIYLGLDTIDEDRAGLLIALATNKCARIISPVPPEAQDIVLEAAGRAYSNVTSAHQVSLGSASASFGAQGTNAAIGGLYLSRSNKAELRLLAGRGSAFSADTMPSGVNAVQSVTVSATSGTFTLTFNGATTSALAYNATAAQVQAALEALTPIGAGNVTVAGSYAVTFTGTLAAWPMPSLTASGAGLAGGTVSVAQTTVGVAAPGTGLPPWGMDYYRASRSPGIYGGY